MSSWANADGIAKRVYDNVVKNAQPACAIITKRNPIDAGIKKIGESYQVAVLVQPPNSVLYAGASPTVTNLPTVRPMIIEQAQALSYETDVHDQIPWAVFTRAEGGQQSVEDFFAVLETAMLRVAMTRHEFSCLAGQTSIGTVEAVTDNTSYATLLITAATWRGGLFWALGPGACIDAYTSTTLNNATGPLVLLGVNRSTARSIDVSFSGTLASEVTAADTLWLTGTVSTAFTVYNDMPGLVPQAANVTGTSMGLSATTYPNWGGNTASVGGPMTPDVLEFYLGELRNRAQDGKLTAYMPETVWQQIFAQVQGMRYLDSSYMSGNQKIGNEDITYTTSRFRNVELVIHPLLRDTEMLIQKDEAVVRVGSREPEFGVPLRLAGTGAMAQKMIMVTGTNSGEAFATVDAGIINREPSCAYSLTGISVS